MQSYYETKDASLWKSNTVTFRKMDRSTVYPKEEFINPFSPSLCPTFSSFCAEY